MSAGSQSVPPAPGPAWSPLRATSIAYLLLLVTLVHDLDHVRQGRNLPAVLYLVAVAALVSLAVTLRALLRNPWRSRPLVAAQGAATVVGVGAVHALPEWSRYADSYPAAGADALSWAIVLAMMAAGLALVVVALGRSKRPAGANP